VLHACTLSGTIPEFSVCIVQNGVVEGALKNDKVDYEKQIHDKEKNQSLSLLER